MGNTKPIGVAYSDPELDSATVSGDVSVTGGVSGATVTATGAVTGASLVNSTSSGAVASNASGGFYFLTTAITANTTTTTAPAGSFGVTSNVTGLGKLFYSDGSKWQFGAIT
jgi:hypothetical protein